MLIITYRNMGMAGNLYWRFASHKEFGKWLLDQSEFVRVVSIAYKDSDNAKRINFEGLGSCYYAKEGFRKPRKGEFYLSGAIVMAYKARNDMDSEYWIAVPTSEPLKLP